VPTMRDFASWTDEQLEQFASEQGEGFGLTFAVEERPRLGGSDDPTVWFAALKQMDAPMAPDGVGILGVEAPSRRTALVGLAQLLDTLTDSERQWLLLRRPQEE
jgi:hypothetical protein